MSNGDIYLTRRICFCASHRLYNPQLSEQENWHIFDKCSYKNGHGHNYELFVTLKGKVDPNTGMIINVNDLQKIVEDLVINDMDHRHLNLDIPEFKTLLPSIENLVVVIWNRLSKHSDINPYLYEVKIKETENNSAYYRG